MPVWSDTVQAQLKRTGIDVQQMIQDRVKKVEEIKHSVELNKVSFYLCMATSQSTLTWLFNMHVLFALYFQASAQREIEESMQVFSELVRSIQKTQAELVLVIEEKQRQTERWAQGLIAELEQEITELKRRNTELETVARTDHIHFLKVREALFQCSVSGS